VESLLIAIINFHPTDGDVAPLWRDMVCIFHDLASSRALLPLICRVILFKPKLVNRDYTYSLGKSKRGVLYVGPVRHSVGGLEQDPGVFASKRLLHSAAILITPLLAILF
jgi:hypothetical protein